MTETNKREGNLLLYEYEKTIHVSLKWGNNSFDFYTIRKSVLTSSVLSCHRHRRLPINFWAKQQNFGFSPQQQPKQQQFPHFN
jgi:hypothetical protein